MSALERDRRPLLGARMMVPPAGRMQAHAERREALAAQGRSRRALVACLALLALAILGPVLSGDASGDNSGGGNLLRQACYTLVFLLAVTAMRPLHRPQRLLVMPFTLLLALGWCWLSLSWAIDPGVALRRLMLTTIVIWTIFLVVREIGYADTLGAIRLALGVFLIANYAAVLLWPSIGIHQFDPVGDPGLVGDWRGIQPQKNFAGAMCAFTILVFMLDAARVAALLRWSLILASGYFLWRSGSKTSGGILALSLVSAWLYHRYDPRYRNLLIPTLVLATFAIAILIDSRWADLLKHFQSPDALTGRVQIWPPLFAFVQDHWATGSGYGSFWNIGPESPIYRYATGWVSGISSGHNGYLDLLVQVGLPGLSLIILGAIVMPLFRLLASRTAPRGQGALLVALIIFCAGHNLTESSLFDRDALINVVLMFAVALIAPVGAAPQEAASAGERDAHV